MKSAVMTDKLRVGFDVGGTFADGVLVRGTEVLAKAKALTTEGVTSGMIDALTRFLGQRRSTSNPR